MADIDGQPELNRRLAAITDTRKLLGRVGLQAVAYAKQTVPRKTGNLGRTIRLGTVTDTEAQIIAGGQGGVGYARVVEFGSKPHDIYPRRKKALFFTTSGSHARLTGSVSNRFRGGNRSSSEVFAKHVRHPGTKPQPFLMPAAERAVHDLGADYIVRAWNEAA